MTLLKEQQENVPEYGYLRDLIGHLVALTHVQSTQVCAGELEPTQLTPKQAVTLYFISQNANTAQKDLATGVGTSPTVMVGILDTLEKRNFIKRVTSLTDRRSQTVELTKDGKRILVDVKKAFFQTEKQLDESSNLSSQEREDLLRLLRKVTKR